MRAESQQHPPQCGQALCCGHPGIAGECPAQILSQSMQLIKPSDSEMLIFAACAVLQLQELALSHPALGPHMLRRGYASA